MSDKKPVYATVDSAKHRRDSVMTADCQRAHRTPIRRPLSLSASRRRLGPIGHGYLGSESLTGGVPAPGRTRSWVHRAHRFLRILTFLFLLCLPVFAQASLGSWVKGVLHLGKYSETVATEVATLPEDHGTWGLAFSPHGRYLAASSPQTAFVQLWDWRKDRVVRRFRKIGSDISSTTALAYSPDGRYLASCHDGSPNGAVQVWNAYTGALVARLLGPHGGWDCSAIAFSPDGHSLLRITDDDGPQSTGLVAYSTRTWAIRWALATRPFEPNALAVSAHGHWAALGGGTNGYVGKWYATIPQIVLVNLMTHRIARTIRRTFLPLSPFTREFPGGGPSKPIIMPMGTNMPTALAWDPSAGTVAIGVWGGLGIGSANVVRIYKARTGALVAGESGPVKTWVTALRYTPHGRYLIEAGIDNTVEIWGGTHQHLLQKIPHQTWSLAVSPHGHYLALGEGRQIQIWRLQS